MKKTFLLLFILTSPLLGQETVQTLNEQDKREILLRLEELKSLRKTIAFQSEYMDREKELDQRERDLNIKAIQVCAQEKAVMEKDRDYWKDRAKTYQQSFEIINKKGGGFGCTLKKIFTLGIAKCH